MQSARPVSGRLLFGRRLRFLRERAELSVEDLAARAGVSIQRLDGIENGRIDAHLDDLDRFAQALGIGIAAIFAGNSSDA